MLLRGRPTLLCARQQQTNSLLSTCRSRALLCCAAGQSSGRYMKVVKSHDYMFYWGSHDHRDAAPIAAKTSGRAAQAAAAAAPTAISAQQVLVELSNAESALELLEIAHEQRQNLQLQHWLRLLFRVLVLLHEDDQLQQYAEQIVEIHSSLPQTLQQAAAALDDQVDAYSSSSSSESNVGGDRQLIGQVADMMFAMAAYASSCHQQTAAVTGLGAGSNDNSSKEWYRSESCAAVVDAVASYNSSWDYKSMRRQDAVSLLWACGQLLSLQQSSSSSTTARQNLFNSLCSNLAMWIKYANNTAETPAGLASLNPSLLDDWAPEDLVDCIAGLAAVQHKSSAAAQLLDAVAHEVYRQLSNRHSTAGSFTVEGVVNLLESYAQLQYKDGPSLRMFDAIAGWLVKRVKARHVQAPASPQQCAAVAAAYARLRHRSVVVPELLAALSQQASKAAAASVEISQTSDDDDLRYCLWTLQHAATFLRSHVELGYRPPELLLMSLMPALMLDLQKQQQQLEGQGGLAQLQQQQQQQQVDALTVLEVLATLRYHPGRQVLCALVSIAWVIDTPSTLSPRQLSTLLFSSAQLAAAPSAAALGIVVDKILLATLGGSSNGGSGNGTSSSSSSNSTVRGQSSRQLLSASDIVRVLWSLLVFDALNIQRFGWLLVAVTHGSWHKLEHEQLVVIKQAQLILGSEGRDVANEVLPLQLLSRMETAWDAWCTANTVHVQPGSSSSRGRDSNDKAVIVKPPACDAASWAAHQGMQHWLQEHAAAAGGSIATNPVLLEDVHDLAQECAGAQQQRQQQQQQRQLVGAWLLRMTPQRTQQEQQGSADVQLKSLLEWPPLLRQRLALMDVSVEQQQQQQQEQFHHYQQQQTAVLLVCQLDWYSSNESLRPLGAAFVHLAVIRALVRQQQLQQHQVQERVQYQQALHVPATVTGLTGTAHC